MDFLKLHYEKLILSLVLVLLAAGAVMIPLQITSNRDLISKSLDSPRSRNIAEYEPADLRKLDDTLSDLEMDVVLDLSSAHHLINPVRWKAGADGTFYPETLLNPATAVQIVEVIPLYLKATFRSVSGAGTGRVKYEFMIAQQAHEKKNRRSDMRRSLEVNKSYTDHPFILREARGPLDNPSELILVHADTAEQITVTPTRPYAKLGGYKVDLKVTQPTEVIKRNLFVGDSLRVGDVSYNIVAIGEDEVTVEAKSTKQRTTISTAPLD
jgi:hypothetical protein